MKKYWMTLFWALLSFIGVKAQNYKVDENKNVVFTRLIEDLPLSRNDIYQSAKHYITNSYKETKYKINIDSEENCIISGEGLFNNFHEDAYFPYSYFLNAPFTLRVDAKDGRARLSIVLTNYTGTRTNQNKKELVEDLISAFPPVNENEDSHRKLYTKAFTKLMAKVEKTLTELEEKLKNTQAVVVDDEW